MASERSVERIASWIQRKVATMLLRDLKDPRVGLITVTRVKVSKDLETAILYYSVMSSDLQHEEAERNKAHHMLQRATPFVQREVGRGLHTRIVPQIQFEYDDAVEGAINMNALLDRLSRERREREGDGEPDETAESDETPPAMESEIEGAPPPPRRKGRTRSGPPRPRRRS